MELRHCRYFTVIAEEGNITRAAQRLHVSQPAISKQLKDLESQLGIELVRREPQGLRLTPPGETFLIHAKDLLDRAATAVDAVRPKPQRTGHVVRVAYISGALPDCVSYAVGRARTLNAGITIRLKGLSPQAQMRELRDGEVDVALLGNPTASWKKEFATRVLASWPIQAVLPAGHRLARNGAIDLAQVAGEDFVGLVEQNFPGRNHCIRETCQRAGFEPQLTSFADNLEVLVTMVGMGAGVTVVPSFVTAPPHAGAVLVRLSKPRVKMESVAAWRKNASTEAIRVVVDLLAQGSGVAQEHGVTERQLGRVMSGTGHVTMTTTKT